VIYVGETKVKRLISVSRLISGVLLCSGLALADYQLDFTIPAFAAGSISYAGSNKPLVGNDIKVSSLEGLGGSKNSGSAVGCYNCLLNFSTGDLASSSPGEYDFSGGGSFTITGTAAGITGTLLSGSLDSTIIDYVYGWDVQTSFFTSNVNPGLTSYYGMPSSPPQYGGAFGIVFTAMNGPNPGSFESTQIFSGNVAAAVPEPASMVLLGTVLLGCVAIVRRRRSA